MKKKPTYFSCYDTRGFPNYQLFSVVWSLNIKKELGRCLNVHCLYNRSRKITNEELGQHRELVWNPCLLREKNQLSRVLWSLLFSSQQKRSNSPITQIQSTHIRGIQWESKEREEVDKTDWSITFQFLNSQIPLKKSFMGQGKIFLNERNLLSRHQFLKLLGN